MPIKLNQYKSNTPTIGLAKRWLSPFVFIAKRHTWIELPTGKVILFKNKGVKHE